MNHDMNTYLITYVDQSYWSKGEVTRTYVKANTIGSAICDVLTTGINIDQIIAVNLKESN